MAPIIQLPTIEVLNTVIREFQPPLAYFGQTLMPIVDSYSNNIMWEILGPITGMTQAHTLDTDPKAIKFMTLARKSIYTAFWKETAMVNESDFLEIRMAGTFGERMGKQLITRRLEQLNRRLDTRIEWMIWQALTGTLAWNENGSNRSIDYEIPGANVVGPPVKHWHATDATILADIVTWANLFRGTGAGNPTMYINKTVAGHMMNNAEIRDLCKQSTNLTQINIKSVTDLVVNLTGVLKAIKVYDEGYLNDSAVWTPFIPDVKAIFIAEGPAGEPFGEVKTTPSVHNGGVENPKSGKFTLMEDNSSKPNPSVTVGAGFYGLPIIFHPSWIVVADIYA